MKTPVHTPLTLSDWEALAEHIARTTLEPHAEEVDRSGTWPKHGFEALRNAGFLGLNAPREVGGSGQGLQTLTLVCETLAKSCSSTAICFGMHCVGTAVISAKATSYQRDTYLRAIAEGKHITTLALSEAGSGSHFYFPETRLAAEGDHFLVNGAKHFVTNGGHADSYVISTVASMPDAELGDFSCLILDKHTPNLRWGPPWNGFGMRGNESRTLHIENAPVPKRNLLGNEGDQTWYVFEVVAPYFIMAMSGVYLGIAQAALEIALDHVKTRTFGHSGEALADAPAIQLHIAEMWTALRKTRLLITEAARLGDSGDPQAMLSILAAKADVAATAVEVVNEAMTLCGGAAYAQNSRLGRLLRDARASHVMAPTTDLLRLWMGRSLLDRPLF
jgi:isovaleryl-CoA dehydrogenase